MSQCEHLANEDKAAGLISAVEEGHNDCVEAVINSFVNLKDGNGIPVLITAARKGNLKCMETLVRAGAYVNLPGTNGITPLGSSVARGYIAFNFLIEKGARVNSPDPENMVVPLIIGAQSGQTETIKILLSAGADVNGKNELGENALQIASSRGHYEIVRLLLEAQATTNGAIERAAEQGHDKCLNILVQSKFDMKECSVALHKAALKGKTDCVHILINAGADINSHHRGFDYLDYHDNTTALLKAAKDNHVQCVKNLIEAGTGVNEDKPGVYYPDAFHNPLYHAAKNGSVECVGYLLDAKPNMRTVAGALVRHCQEGNDFAVDLLIKAGANVNWEHEEFCLTPLEAAAKHGHNKCVQLFCKPEWIKS